MTDPNTERFGFPTAEQALTATRILRTAYGHAGVQPVIVVSSPRQRGADFVVTVYGDPPGVNGIETPRLEDTD